MAKQTTKLNRVHIETFPDGTAMVTLDGKDISQLAKAADIDIHPPSPITITIEYACYEQFTLDGVAEVVHVCPKKAR